MRPKRPCAASGCGVLTDAGRCARHQTEVYRADQSRRGTSAQRGYGSRHRNGWAVLVLNRHPLCGDPFRAHGAHAKPAKEADHIVPRRYGGTWSLSNGWGLCKSCHSQKTAREASFGRTPDDAMRALWATWTERAAAREGGGG